MAISKEQDPRKLQLLADGIEPNPGAPEFVVVAELSYSYRPVTGAKISGPFDMNALAYRFPRVGGRVECDDC